MASNDVLEQLIGAEWRNVPFPTGHMELIISSDLVEHKRPDQWGFHVENTGANSLVMTATVPCRNNLRPAPSEKWFGRTLYPEIFRALVAACADGSSGQLIHPELGPITAKCRRAVVRWLPEKRDGADIDIEWIQSVDEGEFLGSISEPSPVATGVALGIQLDEQVAALVPPPPEMEEDTVSFEEMMRSIQAWPDTATLLSKKVGGLFHRVASKIDRLEEAMVRFNTVRYWPIVDGIEHMRATLFDLQRKFAVDQKVIREYIVRAPATLSTLAQLLGQNIDDMIRLNRDKIEKPVIDTGARVKYYKKAA